MENYQELYYFLFNRITDMIQELQQLQQQAEDAYLCGLDQATAQPPQAQLPAAKQPDAPQALSPAPCEATPGVRPPLPFRRVRCNPQPEPVQDQKYPAIQ